ncbi:hypothetical protein BJF78_17745 [Pseudonocardia sp. CNS-139]|nr:hypothetical protein BJF78_17745 [Pseudonocardia sp. CNS-139]
MRVALLQSGAGDSGQSWRSGGMRVSSARTSASWCATSAAISSACSSPWSAGESERCRVTMLSSASRNRALTCARRSARVEARSAGGAGGGGGGLGRGGVRGQRCRKDVHDFS